VHSSVFTALPSPLSIRKPLPMKQAMAEGSSNRELPNPSHLQMTGELRNPWAHEAGIVTVPHPYGLPVRARVEHDLFIRGKTRIDYGLEIEQIAEGRFGAGLAPGKQVTKF